jgi:putative ABC transport system ATP-binding protein
LINLDHRPDLADGLVGPTVDTPKYLGEPGVQNLVERFDPQRYIRNATLAENPLFEHQSAHLRHRESRASNAYVRRCPAEIGLAADLFRDGPQGDGAWSSCSMACTPGHAMLEASFTREDDLPFFMCCCQGCPTSDSIESLAQIETACLACPSC